MNSLLRKAAHLVENSVSSRLTQSWRKHRRFEEQYVGRLLAELRADCVLDVGANNGGYARMLREYSNYRGLIVSFEPTPDVLRALEKNSANDPLWHVEPFALGSSSGRARFRTMPPSSSEGNSFLPLNEEGSEEIVEIEVEIRKLSDVIPRLREKFGFSRPFLKMDTQGFDLAVFAGVGEAAEQIVGLQSELSIDPFYKGAPDWMEALNVYRRAGFELSTLVANNLDWFPRAREIDCIMYRPQAYHEAKGA